jgi:hypothetical protein
MDSNALSDFQAALDGLRSCCDHLDVELRSFKNFSDIRKDKKKDVLLGIAKAMAEVALNLKNIEEEE